MIKANSTIVYGSQVCKVSEIKKMTFGKTERQYYVLNPVYDEKNVIYVPVDNQALTEKMKEILSAQELYELINNMPENESVWIEDDKLRAETYKNILNSGSREEIIKIIKTLYERKENVKKLHSSDEIIFARAEKAIYDEFALVLDIKREEVTPFILKQITKNTEK